jgi:ADP-ribosyl-[dinitrogen reductase] hydrolase
VTPSLSLRAAGALVGLAAGRSLALGEALDGGLVLTWILAEELAAGKRDLQALARRWVDRLHADPRGVDPETAAALAHLARHDAPPARAAGRGSDPLVRCVPVALAAFDVPRTLVSATFHIASLTHPDPLVAWSAVALNVALARLLQGKRDFVPDVVEALRSNEVPAELLAAVRRVPLPSGTAPSGSAAAAGSELGSALGDVEAALRMAHHEPLLERGLRAAAGPGPSAAARAGVAGALLGARDGAGAMPADWTSRVDGDILRSLAARLVRTYPAAV